LETFRSAHGVKALKTTLLTSYYPAW